MKHENYIAREDKITIPVTEYKRLVGIDMNAKALERYLRGGGRIDFKSIMFFLKVKEPRDCTHNGSGQNI